MRILHRIHFIAICGIVTCFAGQVSAVDLLTDDFNDNSLDAAKWSVNLTSGSAVTEQNMRLEMNSRGHLVSVPQFDPDVIGGLSLSGTWTVVNRDGTDFFQVLTRSDGIPGAFCCGETENGIEFFSDINGGNVQLNIATRGGSLSVGQVNKFGDINAENGDVFDFEIRDNRGFLSFSMREQGDPSSAASVTARLNSDSFALNHVAFHNREGGSHVAALDDANISALTGNAPVAAANVPTGGILAAAPAGFEYAKGDPGWDVTDTFYNSGSIVAVANGSGDDGFGNGAHDPQAGVHNAEIARGNVNPASITGSTNVRGIPVLDFSDPNGGSGRNYNLDLPFVGDTAADDANFTTRALGLIEITAAGDYTFRQSADDTTFLQIDTVVDGVFTADTACCDSADNLFTFTEAGLFPIEFVFGENGGGAGVDLLVNGPGTDGNFVLLGDVLSGSPGIFLIETVDAAAAVPEPTSLAIWTLIGLGLAGFGYYRLRRKK